MLITYAKGLKDQRPLSRRLTYLQFATFDLFKFQRDWSRVLRTDTTILIVPHVLENLIECRET